MPTRNTQVKTNPRIQVTRPVHATSSATEENENSFSNFFKFGESYTSLILGIIVVIIATVLLLSFIRNKNVTTKMAVTPQTVAIKTEQVKNVISNEHKNDTNKNTARIVEQPQIKIEPSKLNIETRSPINGSVYTVVKGDSLWTIAEAKYKSGYNWVDIAKANNLSNPSIVYSGMKLTLPKVETKLATAPTAPSTNRTLAMEAQPQPNTQMGIPSTSQISGNTYTIVRGDSLWSIAVRAYGDGYQWVKIEKANNLVNNPGLIHAGNTLTIPR